MRQAFERADALCLKADNPLLRLRVLASLRLAHHPSAAYASCAQFTDEMMSLSRQAGVTVIEALAHAMAGWTEFAQGRLLPCRDSAERALTLCNRQSAKFALQNLGHEPWTGAHIVRARVLWLLGHPDQAQACALKAVDEADALEHQYTVLFARTMGQSTIALFRREVSGGVAGLQTMMATAERLGFEELKVVSARNLGVALGLDGRIDEGLACLRAALQTQIAHGTHSWLSLFSAGRRRC